MTQSHFQNWKGLKSCKLNLPIEGENCLFIQAGKASGCGEHESDHTNEPVHGHHQCADRIGGARIEEDGERANVHREVEKPSGDTEPRMERVEVRDAGRLMEVQHRDRAKKANDRSGAVHHRVRQLKTRLRLATKRTIDQDT